MSVHKIEDAKAFKKPGRYSDGGGLFLIVRPTGSRSYSFKYRDGSKTTEIGLGGVDVTLDDAREKAADLRKTRRAGIDPKAQREAEKAAKTVGADATTFGEFMRKHIDAMSAGFKNEKTGHDWKRSIENHAAALLPLRPAEITVGHIVAVLRPIWTTKPKTAREVRARIERVLSAAKVAKLRTGENVAQWKDNLEHVLPKQKKRNRHHAAADYDDVPAIVAEIRANHSPFDLTSEALELCILTAVRTANIRFMEMSEVDFDKAIWTLPAARMKVEDAAEHNGDFRVPLSARALEILRKRHNYAGKYVFSGIKGAESCLGMNALNHALARVRPGLTVHGFRSSFRDWIGDETDHPREIAEHALAHTVGGKVERAYRRKDALAKRRLIMDDWAAFVTSRPLLAS